MLHSVCPVFVRINLGLWRLCEELNAIVLISVHRHCLAVQSWILKTVEGFSCSSIRQTFGIGTNYKLVPANFLPSTVPVYLLRRILGHGPTGFTNNYFASVQQQTKQCNSFSGLFKEHFFHEISCVLR